MKKLKVVNIFGGPGTGKSTARAGLFNLMKVAQMSVEETTEYAKDVTWDDAQPILSDALFVLANQNRKLFRIKDKVEWAITDSPLLLSVHYTRPDYLPGNFQHLVWELWDTFENHNFLLRRSGKYDPVGRNQTEKEAIAIDEGIKEMLIANNIPFTEIDATVKSHVEMFKSLGFALPDAW